MEFSPSLGLLHPQIRQKDLGLYLVPTGIMLKAEGRDFYYINECIIYFGVKFGSISPRRWNQLVWQVCYLYCHSPHPERAAYGEWNV